MSSGLQDFRESLLNSFYESNADLQYSVHNYNSANIFRSQNFASLPMRLNSLAAHDDHNSLTNTHIYDSGQTFLRRNQ